MGIDVISSSLCNPAYITEAPSGDLVAHWVPPVYCTALCDVHKFLYKHIGNAHPRRGSRQLRPHTDLLLHLVHSSEVD